MTRLSGLLQSISLTAAALLTLGVPAMAQTADTALASPPAAQRLMVPQLARYDGAAQNRAGDTVEMIFRIYAAQEGGEALWSETQRVYVGQDGKYSVFLGDSSESGLPQTVFVGGQARWLGVSIERAPEQPRMPLASAAYAMKAADAETLAGVPAAEFVTRTQLSAQLANASQAPNQPSNIQPFVTPSGTGTANTVPLWTNSTTLGNSAITQIGTSAAPLVGIGTATPATTLQVAGASTLQGNVAIPAPTAATAAAGVNSPNLALTASSFKSGAAALNQTFAWQSAATGNNTTTPAANLNLLYGAGTNIPAPTGLTFAPNGIINFAAGQKFPGTGTGTITGVTATGLLTGGGTSGTISIGLATAAIHSVLNPFYAQLGANNNSFTGSLKVAGNVTAAGALTGLTLNGTTANLGTVNVSTGAVLSPAAAATAAAPVESPALTLSGNAFNSSSALSVAQNFSFATTPLGNNTTAPSGKLDLFYSPGAAAPAPTGLSFNANGLITFAPGQTFPTLISGVTTTAPLTGGGTSGSLTLGLNLASLASSLNNNYAQLGTANVFLMDQTVQGNLNAFKSVSGNVVSAVSSFNLGPNLFDTGFFGQNSSFLGFSKNSTITGSNVVGVGLGAMSANTSGWDNTGVGYNALLMDADGSQNTGIGSGSLNQTVGGCSPNPPPPPAFSPARLPGESRSGAVRRANASQNGSCSNPQGYGNTAAGYQAGANNITGIQTTSLGYMAGPDAASTGLIGATAIGANATVSQNYSVVLGQTNTTPGALNASVGIGTATPMSALDVVVHAEGQLGPTLTLTNPSLAGGGQSSIDFNTTPPQTGVLISYNPGIRIQAEDNNYSDNLSFYSNTPGSKDHGLRRNMTIYAGGGAQIVGNLNVTGILSKGGGSFKIDHPMDPANKYLSHSFVESPDMMNIYNGLVVLDAHGKASVQMPDWFESLNSDFRYQLTAIGAPGPNLYIAEEINGNHFSIAGGKPGMKVSWQVTGIRQDAWANAHRIPVEEDKPANERGYYLHPDLYGVGPDRQVGNAPKEK